MPAWIIGGALLGSSLVSGITGSNAASSAAAAQEQAAQEAAQVQLQMFNQTQANLQPYMTAGGSALNRLMYLEGLGPPSPQFTPITGSTPAPGDGSSVNPGFTVNDAALAAANPTLWNTWNSLSATGTDPNAPNNKNALANWGNPQSFDQFVQNWQQMYGNAQGTPNLIQQFSTPVQTQPGAGQTSPPPINPSQSPLNALYSSVAGGPPTPPTLQGFTPPTFNPSTVTNDPGYQFQVSQALQGANAQASAAGGISGNSLEALSNYDNGLAATNYNQDWARQYQAASAQYATGIQAQQQNFANQSGNYWDQYQAYVNQQNQLFGQLQTLAGSGQNAAASLGGFSNAAATNIGNAQIGAGNAAAAGIVGSANAIGNSVSNLGTAALLNPALFNFTGSGTPAVNTSGYTPNYYAPGTVTSTGTWT